MRNMANVVTCRRRARCRPGIPSRADGATSASTSRGEHVELVPLAPEHADELARGGDRRPLDRTASPRSPATPSTWRATSPTCSPSARRHRLPFAQRRRRRRPARRLHPLPRDAPVARPAGARRGRDRRHVAGRRRPAHAGQHRGQAAAADPRLRGLARRSRRHRHRRPQRAQPPRRSSASAPASRASCATTARRWCPARPAGPGTRRCSPSPTTTGRPSRQGLLDRLRR